MTLEELIKAIEGAERSAREGVGLPPHHLTDFAHFPFAFAIDQIAEFGRITSEWSAREPDSPPAAYYSAWAAIAFKEYEKANVFMERCQALARDDGRERMRFGHTPDESTLTLPVVSGDQPPGPALFMGCDPIYFKNFCIPLLRSLSAHSPGANVHIHLMNKNVDVVRAAAKGLRLNVSLSHEDPAEFIAAHNLHPAGYFNAVRLIRFADALETAPGGLCLCDVDGLVTGDISPVFSFKEPLGVQIMPGRLAPFYPYNAQLVAAAPGSLAYFRRVKAILRSDLPYAWWGMDQYALFSAAIAIKPDTFLIGPTLSSMNASVPGTFWFTPGRAKAALGTDESRYAEAFRKYRG